MFKLLAAKHVPQKGSGSHSPGSTMRSTCLKLKTGRALPNSLKPNTVFVERDGCQSFHHRHRDERLVRASGLAKPQRTLTKGIRANRSTRG